MARDALYTEMRRRADPVWKAVFAHPFVTGIGDGTLPRDRYEFFLKQDYLYLIDFGRVFALASAKARALEDMRAFSTLLGSTLNAEMELHRKTCAALGIPAEELEGTRRSLVTCAYTDFLVRTCYEGGLPDILAALCPCACGYAQIGRKLEAEGLPDEPFYRDWIRTYSSPEFQELAHWLVRKTNELGRDAPDRQREHRYRLYEASARFEYLFFDMSWKKEEWPAAISFEEGAPADER